MTPHMSTHVLTMGTRGSPLALAQSRQVARALEAAHPGLRIDENIIRTTGDKQQGASLPSIGGKGVFTLEIEAALLDGTIDFAVHSLKDLPPDLPDGLCLACIPKRESSADAYLLSPNLRQITEEERADERAEAKRSGGKSPSFPMLPPGARVGTSSLRRAAQLLHYRPDLKIVDIRGNIDTRIRKLDEGSVENFDAIVLARAGLNRLGINRGLRLKEGKIAPAPGQGALAIEARRDDKRVLDVLQSLEDDSTRAQIVAERACMKALGAGCSTPFGARASVHPPSEISMRAVVLSPDGKQRIFVEVERHAIEDAENVGLQAANKLLEAGAGALLST
jgi:hydroxymethylbilane synthase